MKNAKVDKILEDAKKRMSKEVQAIGSKMVKNGSARVKLEGEK